MSDTDDVGGLDLREAHQENEIKAISAVHEQTTYNFGCSTGSQWRGLPDAGKLENNRLY